MTRRELIKAGLITIPFVAINPFCILGMPNEVKYSKIDFGHNFVWGVATAAYQIEGARNVDDKGVSIWDTFTHGKKNVLNNENGDIACDFYHNYERDIEMINFETNLIYQRHS